MTALDLSSTVGVVGSGTMGQGIAQGALGAGHRVRLY
ncbi:3-hydroxyacyl-CoA dehydrogenase NAD-binding domain-containing protein, partial [Streptomyces sp. NPDC127079]